MLKAGKVPILCLFSILFAQPGWAELGEFAKEGPQFLLKNGDFRQLTIVIVVMIICLIGIAKVVKDGQKNK